MTMKILYVRTSTTHQNDERQLVDTDYDRIFEDKLSGKNTERPQLKLMLDIIRPDDLIEVHSMDRLARNTRDLLELVDTITQKGASIRFKKENLTFNSNTNDLVQKLMLTIIGAVAEMERELIASRVREGVALAKEKGKYKGGKKKLSEEQVKILNDMYTKHYSLTKIAKELHISRPTVYSYLKKDE